MFKVETTALNFSNLSSIFFFCCQKADKRALENLISRTKFDQSIGTLDQALQDALQRLDGYVRSSVTRTRSHFRLERKGGGCMILNAVGLGLNVNLILD